VPGSEVVSSLSRRQLKALRQPGPGAAVPDAARGGMRTPRSHAVVGPLRSLEHLELRQVRVASLDGLEQAAGLSTLRINFAPRLRSIAAVRRLGALEDLSLDSCKRIEGIECIGDATGLQYLSLSCLPVPDPSFIGRLGRMKALCLWSVGRIPSLAFLAGLRELGSCQLVENVVVEDGDMAVLLGLPALTLVVYTERRHYRPRLEEIRAALDERKRARRELRA